MGCVFETSKCTNALYTLNDKEVPKQEYNDFFIISNNPINQDPKIKEPIANNEGDVNSNADEISNRKINIISSPEHNQLSSANKVKSTNSISLIPYPRIKLLLFTTNTSILLDTIIITPNSIKYHDNPIKIFPSSHKYSFGKDLINDCALNDPSIGASQFSISYLSEKYHIMDNVNGTGLFVKIVNRQIITSPIIVSFGADHMYLHAKKTGDIGKEIKIKFCQMKDTEYQYSSKDKDIITIGRSNKCDICYKEESVSKVQCTIMYINDDWVIIDGSYEENEQRCSTNGIWLLANKAVEIKNEMNLKTGSFKISVQVENDYCDDNIQIVNNNNSTKDDEPDQ